jgi:hypothetical protein
MNTKANVLCLVLLSATWMVGQSIGSGSAGSGAAHAGTAGQSTTPGQTTSPRNTNPAPGTAAPTPGTAAPTPGTAAPKPGTASPKPGTAPNTNGSTQQSPNDTPTPGTTSPGSETPGATTPPPEPDPTPFELVESGTLSSAQGVPWCRPSNSELLHKLRSDSHYACFRLTLPSPDFGIALVLVPG